MLARIRLENALVLMRHTGMTLDRIAMLCGYSTGFALSKSFQRLYGKSPRRAAAEAAVSVAGEKSGFRTIFAEIAAKTRR